MIRGATTAKDEVLDQATKKKKIDRTISWCNKHGNLKSEIDWQSTNAKLKKIGYGQAQTILGELTEKGSEINKPTAWLIAQCNRLGANGSKDGRKKIQTTIWWWNNEGGLTAAGKEIKYEDVAEPLSRIDSSQACRIINEFGKKKDTINNPTGWICGYAQRIEKQSWQPVWQPAWMPGGHGGYGKGWSW